MLRIPFLETQASPLVSWRGASSGGEELTHVTSEVSARVRRLLTWPDTGVHG